MMDKIISMETERLLLKPISADIAEFAAIRDDADQARAYEVAVDLGCWCRLLHSLRSRGRSW